MADSLPLLTRVHRTRIRALLLDRQVRAQEGIFVVEGAHAVRDLLIRFPQHVSMLVTSDGYLLKEEPRDRLIRQAATIQQYACSNLHFLKLSDLAAPQGILAVVHQPTWNEQAVLRQPIIFGLFGEHLQDPTNVGAIIRTAAALHVSALWLTSDSFDVYHPKVVRATSGALLALPVFLTTEMPTFIRAGCQLFTAEVEGDMTVSIDDIKVVPRKFVFAVGNESRGLSAPIRAQATTRFTIPLSHSVESLNVAATVAIATFYFSRLPKGE